MAQVTYGYDWRNADSPIKVDSEGRVRVLILGNSGVGKSTTAKKLGEMLGYPVMHLDQVHWRPNWASLSDEEFKEEVKGFVEANESWIIDGNYTRVVGDILQEKATCILWLDPPFTLYFPRLLWRTFGRVFRFKEPCSAGCEERLSNIFTWGEKSIIWWCWNHHDVVQKRCLALMQESRENKASKWVRLGGRGRDAEEWFSRVATIGKNI